MRGLNADVYKISAEIWKKVVKDVGGTVGMTKGKNHRPRALYQVSKVGLS